MKYFRKYPFAIIIILIACCLYINANILICIVGISCLVIGIASIKSLYNTRKNGIKTSGILVSFEIDEGYKIPILEFETNDGQLIKGTPSGFTSTDADTIVSYKELINTTMPIIYNPENAQSFILGYDPSLHYAGNVVIAIVGVIIFVAGIVEIYK